MNSKKLTKIAALALACAGLCMVGDACAQAQAQSTDNTVTGISKPSSVAKVNLNSVGIVREMPVQEGQTVKKGDLLLQQDDRQERAELESSTLEGDSDVEIRATSADRDVKKVELKRVEDLSKHGSATPSELEEAQIKVVYADAQVDLAKLKQQTKKFEAKRLQAKVDQMRLTSPEDGVVEHINVSVGEVTNPDPQKPVMTVVKLNPLWIEFYLPTPLAQKLKVGQQMDVKYAGQEKWIPTKLIYRAPVAESSSDMQQLRLEMANPNNGDAGQQMQVKLPPELGPATSGTAQLPTPQ
jgi:RND family efflux transporter MFP subunit